MRSIPLVGREQERDALWTALERVTTERRAHVVLLHGNAGHGKTRLGEWLCRTAHEAGAANPIRATHGPVEGPAHGLAAGMARHFSCVGMTRAQILTRTEGLLRGLGLTDPAHVHAASE